MVKELDIKYIECLSNCFFRAYQKDAIVKKQERTRRMDFEIMIDNIIMKVEPEATKKGTEIGNRNVKILMILNGLH